MYQGYNKKLTVVVWVDYLVMRFVGDIECGNLWRSQDTGADKLAGDTLDSCSDKVVVAAVFPTGLMVLIALYQL